MRVIIHIGYPKTATTWLQKHFFPHISNYSFVDCREFIQQVIQPYALNFDAVTIRKFFLNKYGNNLIISVEGIIGTLHSLGLNGYLTKEHAYRIKNIFPEAQIIMFIRRQEDMIASSYYQYIAGGGTYSVNKYLFHPHYRELPGISLFRFEFFKYHYTINLYEELFRKEQLFVYLYEDFRHNNRMFIDTFCKTHQLHMNAEHTINFNVEREKLRVGLKNLTRIANLFTRRRMLNKYYLVNIPGWYYLFRKIRFKLLKYSIFGPRPGSRKILGTKNYQYIQEYYKESNRMLIKKYNLQAIQNHNYSL